MRPAHVEVSTRPKRRKRRGDSPVFLEMAALEEEGGEEEEEEERSRRTLAFRPSTPPRPTLASAARGGREPQFDSASLQTRAFLCLGRCLETKKTCLLIFLIVLILVVEFTKLFVPAGSLAGYDATTAKAVQLATRLFETVGAATALVAGKRGVGAFAPRHVNDENNETQTFGARHGDDLAGGGEW